MYKYWWFDEAVPLDICDKIIEVGKSLVLEEAVTRGENFRDESIRKTEVSWISHVWIKSILNQFVRIANKNAWNYDLYDDSENAQFTIYKPNYHYEWHNDQSMYEETPRKLSCVLMLSDPEEYTGGKFSFLQKIKTEKIEGEDVPEITKKGNIIVFPSANFHKVEPVTSGERITLVSWTHGPNFK